MSGDLHEQLVQAAARKNVSLNRFVTGVLADSVSAKPTAAAPVNDAGETTTAGTDETRSDTQASNPGRSLRVALAANLLVVVLAAAVAVVLLVLALQRGI
jgi:hypothetical protein